MRRWRIASLGQEPRASLLSGTAALSPLGARNVRRAKTVDDNLLNTLANGASSSAGVRVVAYLFAWFIIGLGIPIFCVIARYNLQASRWSMRHALHPHHDRQAGGRWPHGRRRRVWSPRPRPSRGSA